MVQNLLRSLEPYPDEGGLAVVPTFMNFSAQTLSLSTQQAIESKLEKKRKNLLGAPAGKKCIFFVDDINMPLVRSRRFMKVPSLHTTRGHLTSMRVVSFLILTSAAQVDYGGSPPSSYYDSSSTSRASTIATSCFGRI